MANTSSRREAFDPDRGFAANKSFMWGGEPIDRNAPFNTRNVDRRKLRQLYDSRFLRMLPVDEAHDFGDYTGPAFIHMSEDEIRLWLSEHGVVPHAKAIKDRLIAKAKRLWDEIQSGVVRPTVVGETDAVLLGHNTDGDSSGVQGAAAPRRPTTRVRINSGPVRGPGSGHGDDVHV